MRIAWALAAVLLAGCSSQAHINGARVTPAAPAPVSTAASVTANCVMGYENDTPDSLGGGTGQYSGFRPGAPKGERLPVGNGSSYFAPALAYQVTLTNDSAVTASVTGFVVIFYDGTATEAGSDQQPATGYIAPGQSLTWTELANLAVDGTGDGGNDGNIPANASTCQVAGWS